MSNIEILLIIMGCFGVLGLGILFLYKKLIKHIFNKQQELYYKLDKDLNGIRNKQKEVTTLINDKHKLISNLINDKHKLMSNLVNNKIKTMPNDLSYLANLEPYKGDKKTIVLTRRWFNPQGGIATRWRAFLPYLEKAGYRVILIVNEQAYSKDLFIRYKTYFINFDSIYLSEEIIRICDFENASLIEFHDDIIGANIDIEKIASFLIVGFAAHANIYSRNNIERHINLYKELDDTYYKQLDFMVEVSGSRRDWYKNAKPEVIDFSIDTSKYSPVFKHIGQKKALLISRLADEKLRNIEPFITECQKRGITFDIIGSGPKKEYLQTTYNLADELFLGQLNAVEYMSSHGSDYLFIAGASQVSMESMSLGYPSLLVCDDSYFITIQTFENALYYDFDKITDSNKTLDNQFKDLYNGKLDDFNCRDLVVKHLDLETNAKKYLAIYEKAMEKRNK